MTVQIKGVIVPDDDKFIYDILGVQATSPLDVKEGISNLKESDSIDVEINSGGGSVFAGSEIYTALKELKNNVNVKIVGLAGSSASVISMAGDHIEMSPTSQMMIHNASGVSRGDKKDLKHTSKILANVDETIAKAYQIKTGLDDSTILNLMDKETWLTPEQAVEKGFADSVMFDDDTKDLVASVEFNNMLPRDTVETVRNMKAELDNYKKQMYNYKQELYNKLDNLKRSDK